jgi:hypothetical protein
VLVAVVEEHKMVLQEVAEVVEVLMVQEIMINQQLQQQILEVAVAVVET